MWRLPRPETAPSASPAGDATEARDSGTTPAHKNELEPQQWHKRNRVVGSMEDKKEQARLARETHLQKKKMHRLAEKRDMALRQQNAAYLAQERQQRSEKRERILSSRAMRISMEVRHDREVYSEIIDFEKQALRSVKQDAKELQTSAHKAAELSRSVRKFTSKQTAHMLTMESFTNAQYKQVARQKEQAKLRNKVYAQREQEFYMQSWKDELASAVAMDTLARMGRDNNSTYYDYSNKNTKNHEDNYYKYSDNNTGVKNMINANATTTTSTSTRDGNGAAVFVQHYSLPIYDREIDERNKSSENDSSSEMFCNANQDQHQHKQQCTASSLRHVVVAAVTTSTGTITNRRRPLSASAVSSANCYDKCCSGSASAGLQQRPQSSTGKRMSSSSHVASKLMHHIQSAAVKQEDEREKGKERQAFHGNGNGCGVLHTRNQAAPSPQQQQQQQQRPHSSHLSYSRRLSSSPTRLLEKKNPAVFTTQGSNLTLNSAIKLPEPTADLFNGTAAAATTRITAAGNQYEELSMVMLLEDFLLRAENEDAEREVLAAAVELGRGGDGVRDRVKEVLRYSPNRSRQALALLSATHPEGLPVGEDSQLLEKVSNSITTERLGPALPTVRDRGAAVLASKLRKHARTCKCREELYARLTDADRAKFDTERRQATMKYSAQTYVKKPLQNLSVLRSAGSDGAVEDLEGTTSTAIHKIPSLVKSIDFVDDDDDDDDGIMYYGAEDGYAGAPS